MKEYLTEDTARQQAALGKLDLWRSYANTGMICLALVFLPLMSHAGGLGIAPLAFFVGVLGYLTARPSSILAIPPWFWMLALFSFIGGIAAWYYYRLYKKPKNLT